MPSEAQVLEWNNQNFKKIKIPVSGNVKKARLLKGAK